MSNDTSLLDPKCIAPFLDARDFSGGGCKSPIISIVSIQSAFFRQTDFLRRRRALLQSTRSRRTDFNARLLSPLPGNRLGVFGQFQAF